METHTPTAQAAWLAVERAVRQHGAYLSIDFGRITSATLRTVCDDWPAVCATPTATFDTTLKAAFVIAFGRLADGRFPERAGRPLLGLTDESNLRNGFHEHVGPPVKIRIEEAMP